MHKIFNFLFKTELKFKYFMHKYKLLTMMYIYIFNAIKY